MEMEGMLGRWRREAGKVCWCDEVYQGGIPDPVTWGYSKGFMDPQAAT